jgi:hypothetical protein
MIRVESGLLQEKWQGYKDSNLGMPESKSGALPAWRYPYRKLDERRCRREGADSAFMRAACQPNAAPEAKKNSDFA